MPLVGSAGDAFAWCTGVDAARALGNGSQMRTTVLADTVGIPSTILPIRVG